MPYKPKTKFEVKDTLSHDDPKKVIYGAEFAVEFEAISATFAEVQGGFDQVKDKLEAGGYSMEEAPAGGAQYGRQEKNGKMTWTEIGSAGSVTWSEVSGKPSTFPPSPHNHDGQYLKTETDPVFTSSVAFGITQTDIDTWNAGGSGGASTWDELTGKPTEFPPAPHNQGWDTITGVPSEFPPAAHNHEIDDVTGLQDALDAAGGTPAWDDVTGKPSEFPPEDHTHDYLTEAPDDGAQYVRQSKAWAEITIPDVDAPDYTLPVALRSGDVQLPLTVDGAKLAVMTRGGELELPLAA